MLTVKVVNRVKMPDLDFQDILEKIAEQIIIPDIKFGIETGQSITGGAFPPNSEETLKRKASRGQGSKPLVATGTLRRSFFSTKRGKTSVVISIDPERSAIGGYLQSGIKSKSGLKQYVFFGISKKSMQDIEENLKAWLQQRIDHASRG